MPKSDTAGKGADSQQTGESSSAVSQSAATTQSPVNAESPEIKALIEAAIQKDRMTEGRKLKTVETRESALSEREKQVKTWEEKRLAEIKAQEDAALEAAVSELPEDKREPQKTSLKAIKDKIRTDRQALEEALAKHQPILAVLEELGINDAGSLKDTIAASKEMQFEMAVFNTAEKYGVSAEILKDKAEKFKTTDPAVIEELASIMPKKAAVENVDSGKGSGYLDLSKLTPRQKIQYGIDHKKT